MNKEIKPFKKEFYNLLNLTNLPQRDLQLNGGGGGIVRGGNWHRGQLSGGNCLRGNCPRGNYLGGNCPGMIVWEAIGVGGNCLGAMVLGAISCGVIV